MATVTVEFTFSDGFATEEDFEGNSSVRSEIEDRAEELVEERNDGFEADDDCVDLDGWCVVGSDCSDYTGQKDWDDFGDEANLDEWGEYSENVDEHGEAFVLRYDDVDDCVGRYGLDGYHGCWSSEEEYAQSFYEDCNGRDGQMDFYIDWERYARDLLMDFSVYEGDDGYHIFSD
jgi:antirestriction protein